LSQLFGDRALVANATGCSSIYGGNLPTTPWTVNGDGRGPAWSNSLFEDNAEFGLGFRLTLDKQREMAGVLVERLRAQIGDALANSLLAPAQKDEASIAAQRRRVAELRSVLEPLRLDSPDAAHLLTLADALVPKSVWIVGGDGWAYDIGFGGLDHVLASGRNVNILVLDTEVYSNTGGQMSKATPRAAVAKFAASGKASPKKDLGLIAMTYGQVYVARIAMGANDAQTVRAFLEAEAWDGPSLIIAYAHCIAHGIDMRRGLENQKLAVQCGHWPLFRFNPANFAVGKNPMKLDSKAPSIPFTTYADAEIRYKMLTKSSPEAARRLQAEAQVDANERWRMYEQMEAMWKPAAAPESAVAAPTAGEAPVSAGAVPVSAGSVRLPPASSRFPAAFRFPLAPRAARRVAHDRSQDALPGARTRQPARALGVAAFAQRRDREAARGCRRCRARHGVAVRRTNPARAARAALAHDPRHRELRRIADLLPRGQQLPAER
jgi:pyruvate-ferredoxin/flavodoxin oxidoreductase